MANLSKLADELKPYMVPWVRRIAISGGGAGGAGEPGGGDMLAHVLASTSALGPFHTVSGLTAGQVLTATGATTARFAQLLHSQLGGIGANDHHDKLHAFNDTNHHSGSLSWANLDKTGSNLAHLATRNYADLLNRGHNIVSEHVYTGGNALDVFGLSAANTIARLVPSSNPGASAQLLKSDADGYLALTRLITPSLTSAGALTIAPANNVSFDPVGNYVVPASNYDINLGAINYKYLTLYAAELWVETLVAQNTLATIGGRILVGPTTTLVQDLGDAVGNTTIHTKHNNLNVGDVCYMEASGKVEFMSVASGPTGSAGDYSYSMYRNLDGSGLNLWYAGDAIFNTGGAGNGFIDLYSLRGMKGGSEYGPTIVGNRRMSSTYNDWEPRWAIGNLQNLYGYGSETYGFAAGQASATWVGVDATNGLRMMRNTTARFQVDASGNLRIKNNAGTDIIALDNDGTSYFAGAMTLGTSGGIYQGSGTFASPTTGLKIWNDTGIGRIGGYNAGTLQWGATTAGTLTAGGGNVVLSANGIDFDLSSASDETPRLAFAGTAGGQSTTQARNVYVVTAAEVFRNDWILEGKDYFGAVRASIKVTSSVELGNANPWGAVTITGTTMLAGTLDTVAGATLELKQDGTSILKSSKTVSAYMELGGGRTVDATTYIDLIGDTTYTDYGLRLLRSSGANGNSQLRHRGTGNLIIHTDEAAAITLDTSNVVRVTIESGGLAKFAYGLAVATDAGGTASYHTLTNVTMAASGAGGGTVKMNGATGRNNAGWIKAYDGTTAIWTPYWTTITG